MNRAAPLDSTGDKYIFTYNGTDTVPYKSYYAESNSYGTALNPTTTYHYFDNLGRNLKDSLVNTTSDNIYYTVIKYSYENNEIYGLENSKVISGMSAGFQDGRDTAILDSYGDVVFNKRYFFNSTQNKWELNDTSRFTYDTKISPFKKLSNFKTKTFGVFPSGETLYFEFPTYHNKLSQFETRGLTFGPLTPFNFQYQNTYNNKGQLETYRDLLVGTNIGYIKITYKAL